jgi:hypothetical protein
MDGVDLMAVPVTAVAVIDADEHEQRRSSGCSAFTDLALPNRLLGRPLGVLLGRPLGVAVDYPSGRPPEYGNQRVAGRRCCHGG